MKEKRFTLEIIEYEDSRKAFGALASGLWFFIRKKTIPTVMLALMGGGGAWWYQSNDAGYHIKIEKAVPVEVVAPADTIPKSHGSLFSVFPEAYAAQPFRQNQMKSIPEYAIIIEKKYYGTYDPRFQIWKMAGKPVLMIWDKVENRVFLAEAQVFDTDRLKQEAK